jgi:hypothetical protein
MEKLGRYILLCFILALILFAWMGRYQLVAVSDDAVVYQLDRWTGNVWLCVPDDCSLSRK